jgi:hypothetical protein
LYTIRRYNNTEFVFEKLKTKTKKLKGALAAHKKQIVPLL